MLDWKNRKLKFWGFGLLSVAIILVWSVWVWSADLQYLMAEISKLFKESVKFLDGVPLIFYSLAIFILPIFFLPVTPIFFLAAARPEHFAVLLAYCWTGVAANMAVSYLVSRRFGAFLRRKLSARGFKIPEIPSYEQYELTILMRMIPGNPLAVQNYALGLANVPFDKYFFVSLPIQFIQITAYVYFGEGIFEGGLSKMSLGISVLFVIAIIARMLDKRYGHKLRNGKKDDGISSAKR